MTNKIIKVGILTSSIDKDKLSGPAICQKELISSMLKIKDSNLELFFIHFSKNGPKEIYKKGKEVVCSKNIIDITKCVKNLNLDLIHMNYLTYKWIPFYFLPIKKVVTIHGDASLVLPRKYFSWKTKLEEYIIRFFGLIKILDNVNLFTVVSESTAKNVHKYLKIPKQKIKVVYNGLGKDIEFKENSSKFIEKKWNIKNKFILNVNNYAPKKNITTLIESFALYKKNNINDVKLILVGSGIKENEKIERVINKFNLSKDIKILEYVSHKDLSYLYSSAIALVNPTLHETFGLPNLEAMACKCPVITSNVFSMPEIVGDAAILLKNPKNSEELYKEIEKLINNNYNTKIHIKKGEKQAKKFSWEKSAEKMIKIYRDLDPSI